MKWLIWTLVAFVAAGAYVGMESLLFRGASDGRTDSTARRADGDPGGGAANASGDRKKRDERDEDDEEGA